MRDDATISGKARPLFFASKKLDIVLSSYLQERVTQRVEAEATSAYRGLDPSLLS